ncbi:unnamed protein product [marine sediment metagenome]|uniref:Uncharacterized protein n=1 Tax=marine sediment metagenome TaxID=412755 RepID=X0WFL5_9ZZZZ
MDDDLIGRIQVVKNDYPVVAAVLDMLRQRIEKLELENYQLQRRIEVTETPTARRRLDEEW